MRPEYEGRLFIDGEFREAESGNRFEVINPADESVVGTAADAASVTRFDGGEDEAVRVANNSRYGLSAYVQTGDAERAWRIAARLKAGTVNIGPSFYLSPDTPFGGHGISGVGREHGEDGFREYLQAKTIASPA
jgi:acyl-CoA reductase-like NAD-dependent aldehyde dehydrogenase